MKILNRTELMATLLATFPNLSEVEVDLADATYAVLPHDDIERSFAYFYKGFLSDLKVNGWKPYFDCDNFSLASRLVAQLMHASWCKGQDKDAVLPQACAFGEVSFLVDGEKGRGHRIAVIITERGVETWEDDPAIMAWRPLNEAEKVSVWRVSM